MDQIKVAVVGAGILGSRHARVFHEHAGARLAAVVDVNPARAEDVAKRFGARAFTTLDHALANERIDAVAIATPDHLHHDTFMAALRAGKHVFVEKPLATTEHEAREMAAFASASGQTVMVNYSQRFVTDHAWIKTQIERGEIGRAQMVISVKFDTIYVPTGMIGAWSAKSSPFLFMSSHDLDLVHWYLAAQPVEVVAHETRGTLDALGVPVHDGVNVLVKFGGGISTNFHASWIHPNTYPKIADGYLQIIGSEGAIFYNNRTRTAEMHNTRSAQKVEFSGPHTADEVSGKITGAFAQSVGHFLDCIREGREPMTSSRRTLPTTLVQTAALDSARTGTPVQIALA